MRLRPRERERAQEQERRHQHQHQAQPIEADAVADAERLDPRHALDELEAGPVRLIGEVVAGEDQERQTGGTEGCEAERPGAAIGRQDHGEHAERGQEDGEAEHQGQVEDEGGVEDERRHAGGDESVVLVEQPRLQAAERARAGHQRAAESADGAVDDPAVGEERKAGQGAGSDRRGTRGGGVDDAGVEGGEAAGAGVDGEGHAGRRFGFVEAVEPTGQSDHQCSAAVEGMDGAEPGDGGFGNGVTQDRAQRHQRAAVVEYPDKGNGGQGDRDCDDSGREMQRRQRPETERRRPPALERRQHQEGEGGDEDREHDLRCRHGPTRLVRAEVSGVATVAISGKGTEEGAGGVGGGERGDDEQQQVGDEVGLLDPGQQRLLGEEPGERRQGGERPRAHQEQRSLNGHRPAEPAHFPEPPHPLVQQHAGDEEQERLERRVGDEVAGGRDAGDCTDPCEHEPVLRDRRGGEELLQVVLVEGDDGGGERGQDAEPQNQRRRPRHGVDERQRLQQQHHARRHHGGGVEEGRDRRRPEHGAGEPTGERELRRLAGGGDDQPEHQDGAPWLRCRRQRIEPERAGAGERRHRCEIEAEIAGAGGDEGAGCGAYPRRVPPPVADQRVGAGADQLEADQHRHQIIPQHHELHGADEQRHEPEEPRPCPVAFDVGGGVDQHQQRRHRDDDGQRCSEAMAGQGEIEGAVRERQPDDAALRPQHRGDSSEGGGGTGGDERDSPRYRIAAAAGDEEGEADEARQQRHRPQHQCPGRSIRRHPFSSFTASTVSAWAPR